MAEGWTREETRHKHRWCEGFDGCLGKAVLRTIEQGHQRCQRCLRKFGIPATEMPHVLNDHDECVTWCVACAENTRRGLNPDGSKP